MTCLCGEPAHTHCTVFETKEERAALGLHTDSDLVIGNAGAELGYGALGGITNFKSLADGIDRLALSDQSRSSLLEEPKPAPPPMMQVVGRQTRVAAALSPSAAAAPRGRGAPRLSSAAPSTFAPTQSSPSSGTRVRPSRPTSTQPEAVIPARTSPASPATQRSIPSSKIPVSRVQPRR